jgi:TonB family protein
MKTPPLQSALAHVAVAHLVLVRSRSFAMSYTLRKFALITAVVVVTAGFGEAQSQRPPRSRPLPDAFRMDNVVHQVPPEYPYEARRSGITGRGILVGFVDFDTGKVTSVKMEKSTGSRILDQAALSAFRQWEFKPKTILRFRTPITYEMARSREDAMEKIRRAQGR